MNYISVVTFLQQQEIKYNYLCLFPSVGGGSKEDFRVNQVNQMPISHGSVSNTWATLQSVFQVAIDGR